MQVSIMDVPKVVDAGRLFRAHVRLHNGSRRPIATSEPWPCQLMYRWLDPESGATIVEHGFRTVVSPLCWPGSTTHQAVRVFAPARPGHFTLRVTMIQEGWRWLDALQPAVADNAAVSVRAAEG